MDARAAVRRALKQTSAAEQPQPKMPRVATEEEALGELQVAEYIIFLLALDTYIRYLEEKSGTEEPEDTVVHKGVTLLRQADSELDRLRTFLEGHLPSPTHKKMLTRALSVRAASASGAARRALQLRTLLSRGGPATMRAVFETNRALKQVREAINAAMIDNADAALDLFAAIPMRNMRLAAWIDLAAKTATSGEVSLSPVEAGTKESVDQAKDLLVQSVHEITSSPEDSRAASEAKTDRLFQVQSEAETAAKKALERSGEPDEPLTRSETVGVAVAAAVAAVSDPSNSRNIPEPLLKLDDEQRSAALTDGRVLVAAGAGAGKSTTLVSRVSYLIKDRRVMPSRILVTSFNTKAANELKEKIGRSVGGDSLQQMSVGTMHSLFRSFIGEYGNREEQIAMGLGKGANGFVQGGADVARAVQKLWAECYTQTEEDKRNGLDNSRPVPRLKDMMLYKSQWSGNNISPAQAKAAAKSQTELDAADWYEMYEGLKGSTPGWKPPCEEKARASAEKDYQEKARRWRDFGGRGKPPVRYGTTFESFLAKKRPNNIRLGDFDDMLSIFRDILAREPPVKKALQGMFDHIMVDECQDLNQVQTDIITMMSEHIKDGADGKSLWMVGDDKQSIYSFRGARPELFTGLDGKEGWKTRMIRTNYRCEPEIVDAANKLIAHNSGQIPMAANPAPSKVRGVGSLKVEVPGDEAEGALSVVEEIKRGLDVPGGDVANNAVLCRTNAELHSYETACIVRGIPYARKGASSFLGSPETSTILGYVQLALGDDYEKMQKALGSILNRPNRFFIAPDVAAQAAEEAISEYARRTRQSIKNVNPVEALRDRNFRESLAEKITKTRTGFKFDKAVEKFYELSASVDEMQANSSMPGFKTTDLFDSILSLRGTASVVDPNTGRSVFVEQSLRETLKVELRDATGDDDDAADEDEDDKPLGNIGFLYQLSKVDPTDPMDLEQDPSTPMGFKAKMTRYAQRSQDLRTDLSKWDKQQQTLPPEKRSPPPGVYLGTVHSTKGAQWANTYVQMPRGKFPLEPKPKPGDPPPDPEEMKIQEESERRLAYVALTRAAKTLTVVCPKVVGGKPAGVSRFVDEAGLTMGENVVKPGTVEAKKEEAEEMDTSVKTAEVLYDDPVPEEWTADLVMPQPWDPEEN